MHARWILWLLRRILAAFTSVYSHFISVAMRIYASCMLFALTFSILYSKWKVNICHLCKNYNQLHSMAFALTNSMFLAVFTFEKAIASIASIASSSLCCHPSSHHHSHCLMDGDDYENILSLAIWYCVYARRCWSLAVLSSSERHLVLVKSEFSLLTPDSMPY